MKGDYYLKEILVQKAIDKSYQDARRDVLFENLQKMANSLNPEIGTNQIHELMMVIHLTKAFADNVERNVSISSFYCFRFFLQTALSFYSYYFNCTGNGVDFGQSDEDIFMQPNVDNLYSSCGRASQGSDSYLWGRKLLKDCQSFTDASFDLLPLFGFITWSNRVNNNLVSIKEIICLDIVRKMVNAQKLSKQLLTNPDLFKVYARIVFAWKGVDPNLMRRIFIYNQTFTGFFRPILIITRNDGFFDKGVEDVYNFITNTTEPRKPEFTLEQMPSEQDMYELGAKHQLEFLPPSVLSSWYLSLTKKNQTNSMTNEIVSTIKQYLYNKYFQDQAKLAAQKVNTKEKVYYSITDILNELDVSLPCVNIPSKSFCIVPAFQVFGDSQSCFSLPPSFPNINMTTFTPY